MVPTGKRASARQLNSLGRHRNGSDDDSARNINEFVGTAAAEPVRAGARATHTVFRVGAVGGHKSRDTR